MWNIYWRFLPRHNRSAAQKNPVNKVCLLFAFSVPTECAAIATGNDFRGLGICHQQAFSRNSGNGISAKYAILRKIALLAICIRNSRYYWLSGILSYQEPIESTPIS